jgi:hypothetical protein
VITATYLRKLLLSILGKPTLTHVVPLNPKVLGSIPGAGTNKLPQPLDDPTISCISPQPRTRRHRV